MSDADAAVAAFARDLAAAMAAGCEVSATVAAACAEALAAEHLPLLMAPSTTPAPMRAFLFAAAAPPGSAPAAAWVAVRGSAGRSVFGGAFTVGSAACCDVQVAGDATVRPTQLIVLSLPACVVVVDAAPDGDTEVIARGPLSGHLRPVLGPYCSTPVVVPAGERVELRLGDETTIFVGQAPAARPASARAAHTEWFCARTATTMAPLATAEVLQSSSCASSRGRSRSRSPRGLCWSPSAAEGVATRGAAQMAVSAW